MESLLKAILDDDKIKVQDLIKDDPTLINSTVQSSRLYEEQIYHWIYVGDTALHLAAAGYRNEIATILLKAGSDVNASQNHRRGRPLHYASDAFLGSPHWNEAQQIEMLKILLDAGAEIDAQDLNGATALHRAVRTRCAAAVKFLLQSGCDPQMRNRSGSTSFHLAVQNTGRGGSGEDRAKQAQQEIIKAFIELGLSPMLKDGNGKTVIDWAKSAWIKEMLIGSIA